MIDVAVTLALIDDVLCSCVEPLVFGHACRGELLGRELKAATEVDSPEQLAAYRAFDTPPLDLELLDFERDVRREWEIIRRYQPFIFSFPLVPDRPLVLSGTV